MSKYLKTMYKESTCRGSVRLGTGCGVCEKCLIEKQDMIKNGDDVFSVYTKPNNCVKPPLGLRPRYIWLEARKKEITEALQRQLEEGESLNESWVDELKEVNDMMEETNETIYK